MKKLGKFLFSMKFALVILVIFVAVCIVGSVVPQGEIPAVYENAYPKLHDLILSVGADDVFHSWWFAVLTVLLCVNLLGCNLVHFPQIVRKCRQQEMVPSPNENWIPYSGDPKALFASMQFRTVKQGERDGKPYRYAIRHRIGYWGAWLTHLGILIIIVGFALGQMFSREYTVYGVSGQEKPVGDTGYSLFIHDFSVDLREDDTVEQYTAWLTLKNEMTGETMDGVTSVNHPWDAEGMRFYQNSTGWAADVAVFRGESLMQAETLCAGEYLAVADKPDLLVAFRAFYPDYTVDGNGLPTTASDRMENPGYLYILYYKGELLGMNVLREGEKITISDYTVVFANPRSYTLISIKRDPFTGIALVGGVVLLGALFVAFYLRTEELWLVSDGQGGSLVWGRSRKGSLLYQERLQDRIERNSREADV